jgi:hypothetical protein
MTLKRMNFTDAPQPKWERSIVFVCDECGGQLETGTTSFDEARADLRENAWGYRRVDDKWCHYCENCKSK